MDISNNMALLFVAGVVLVVAIYQYLRAERLVVKLEDLREEMIGLSRECELAHEKCHSWERKYNRAISAKVLGAIKVSAPAMAERFNKSSMN